MPSKSLARTLPVLVLFQALALIPFRFTTTMGERDSYRMLLGMLDGVARGSHFASPLLYNRQVSFGYYALIYGLTSPLGYSPGAFIAVMNAVSLLAAILFVIPFFLVVERLFDRSIAIASCLILAVLPVWWNVALYGHPMTPAMLLFFSALALLVQTSERKTPLWARLLVLILLAIALTFRFDLIVLIPALAAVVWRRYKRIAPSLLETAFYAIGAIVLFKLAQLLLPAVHGGPPPESILALVERFHSAKQFTGDLKGIVRFAIVIMGQGFTPLLLVLALPAFWIVFRRRNLAQILFTAGVIVPISVFFLPNPYPARHYLAMAPAIGTSAALSGCWLLSLVWRRIPSGTSPGISENGWIYGAAGALACVLVSLGFQHAPGSAGEIKSPFITRFTLDNDRIHHRELAADLLSIPGPTHPILVLCDSTFVTAQMEMLSHGVTVQPHWFPVADEPPLLFHEIKYHGNSFEMLEQSWNQTVVKEAIDRMNVYPGDPILVDPYDPVISYRGSRPRAHLERTPAGERIDLP